MQIKVADCIRYICGRKAEIVLVLLVWVLLWLCGKLTCMCWQPEPLSGHKLWSWGSDTCAATRMLGDGRFLQCEQLYMRLN